MDKITQLGKSGQATIPASVRTALGIAPGDHVRWTVVENRLIGEPVSITPKVPLSEAMDAARLVMKEHAGVIERLKDL